MFNDTTPVIIRRKSLVNHTTALNRLRLIVPRDARSYSDTQLNLFFHDASENSTLSSQCPIDSTN